MESVQKFVPYTSEWTDEEVEIIIQEYNTKRRSYEHDALYRTSTPELEAILSETPWNSVRPDIAVQDEEKVGGLLGNLFSGVQSELLKTLLEIGKDCLRLND